MGNTSRFLKMEVGDRVQVAPHPDHPELIGRWGSIDSIDVFTAGAQDFEHIHVVLEATNTLPALGWAFKYRMLLQEEETTNVH